MVRLRCDAKETGNELVLLFHEYREGNVGRRYKVGDTLLKLIRIDKNVLTEWGKVEPQFDEHHAKRSVYFEKQSRRNIVRKTSNRTERKNPHFLGKLLI
jgi:hypothetical protein